MSHVKRVLEHERARLDPGLRFQVRDVVAVEAFEDCSLVLLCDGLHLRKISGLLWRLLALVDGEHSAGEIARVISAEHGMPISQVLEHVGEALAALESQRIIGRLVQVAKERRDDMNDPQYLANPDVSFRQEDDDGGILFNKDTDALEVINPVAVEIWIFLAAPHTHDEVVAHLTAVCEGAVVEQVRADVGEFLDAMLKKGFVGIVEEAP